MSEADNHTPYRLDDQVGFLLRRALQRHMALYARAIPDLTSMQFATLAKLAEAGALSQNALGRLTAMDAATIKGVVDRLGKRGLVQTENDKTDRRRTIVSLSDEGRALFETLESKGRGVTTETLAPLSGSEQAVFLHLLRKLTWVGAGQAVLKPRHIGA
ncbi:MAG TPA: MarR family transcriptional regulator, partial [Aliiroseovarius sp.]|nr:MarR family transcriptional regulator [Aliiroseovarius sp.]